MLLHLPLADREPVPFSIAANPSVPPIPKLVCPVRELGAQEKGCLWNRLPAGNRGTWFACRQKRTGVQGAM